MGFLRTLGIAIRALSKNKMRAILTVLGVVIGIAAVTTMVSIGQSANALLNRELEGFGTNVIVVFPADSRRGGVRGGRTNSLTADDCDAIVAECPLVLAATPFVYTGGQVVFENNNIQPNEMMGVGIDYGLVRNWRVKHGNFFDQAHVDRGEKVCVVGHSIVTELFQTTNPIDKIVRINGKPFTIIGVLETKGPGLTGEDQDKVVLMPYTTVRKTLHGSPFNDVHALMVSARESNRMAETANEIKQLLADRHDIYAGQELDFQIQTTAELANMLGIVTGTMTMMLASIAGISLLVGGVGIMNIMLVSVTERTREIGIRMAVGARGRDILFQFLIESVLLSCIGGLIGFGLGVGASVGITMLINSLSAGSDWPVIVSIPAGILAFVFAAGVGIFFGFYPARRASKLDPIDALRYE